jgi:hypothetical protein
MIVLFMKAGFVLGRVFFLLMLASIA